ncbi:hypothetical protein ACFL17_07845, partial [Pseudomonadota bacterium]
SCKRPTGRNDISLHAATVVAETQIRIPSDGDSSVVSTLEKLSREYPEDPVLKLYYQRQLDGLSGVDIITSK